MNGRHVAFFVFLFTLAGVLAACGGSQPPGEPTDQSAANQAVQSPAEAPTAQPAPGVQVRSDLPVMPDAAGLTVAENAEGYSVTYTSAGNVEAVTAFYQAQMPSLGWAYRAEVSSTVAGMSGRL